MAQQPKNPEEPWQPPESVEIAGSVTVPPPLMSGALRISFADQVLLKESDTVHRLYNSAGQHFLVRERVFVVISGHGEVEVTTPATPEEIREANL